MTPPEMDDHTDLADKIAREAAVSLLGHCLRTHDELSGMTDQEVCDRALLAVRGCTGDLFPRAEADGTELAGRFQDFVGLLFLREFNRLCAAWRSDGGQA
ncbi:hypothetical protein [Xanthobacter flavus]|uniref:hypothetical protein n=1 Tax=Xanthobacter flavus TaxID=281 RepID=UPI003728457E